MGQQPNIELEIADLPRPSPKPDPARAWIPGRPGELGGPEDAQFGAGFGTVGPDSGYALSLVKARDLELADGERRANTDIALAAIASARAALFGRAPTGKDVDLAMALLGLDPAAPESVRRDMGESRKRWFAAVAHHPGRLHGFIASLDHGVLALTAEDALARTAEGKTLINH